MKQTKRTYAGERERKKRSGNKLKTITEEQWEGMHATMAKIERCREAEREGVQSGRYITQRIGSSLVTATPDTIAHINKTMKQ